MPVCRAMLPRLTRFVLSQGSTCTTLAERCMPNASVTAASSCRVGTATTIMAFIPLRSARSPVGVAWKFSTTKSLLSCWHSLWTMVSRQCMNSPKCALFEWASWRWVLPTHLIPAFSQYHKPVPAWYIFLTHLTRVSVPKRLSGKHIVLSSHHATPRDRTLVSWLGSRHLYPPLNHIAILGQTEGLM